MLISQSISQLPSRSQVDSCRFIPTTGLFDKLSYSECCVLCGWRSERSCHFKRVVGTQLLLLSRDISDSFGLCHPYREPVRNGQVANIFTRVPFSRCAVCSQVTDVCQIYQSSERDLRQLWARIYV